MFLSFILLFCSSNALCEGKLKTTEKNLVVFNGEDNGYFYAKVENIGDTAVGVDSGDLVIFSENDDIILSTSYVTTSPSYVVLEPNDYLYVKEFLWDSALENVSVSDYIFSIGTRKSDSTITKVPCEAEIALEGIDSYNNYINVTFTNTASEPIYNYFIVAALYDAEGQLVFVESTSMNNAALHPASTITLQLYVDSDLMEYYAANDIVLTTADAMVCYKNN